MDINCFESEHQIFQKAFPLSSHFALYLQSFLWSVFIATLSHSHSRVYSDIKTKRQTSNVKKLRVPVSTKSFQSIYSKPFKDNFTPFDVWLKICIWRLIWKLLTPQDTAHDTQMYRNFFFGLDISGAVIHKSYKSFCITTAKTCWLQLKGLTERGGAPQQYQKILKLCGGYKSGRDFSSP